MNQNQLDDATAPRSVVQQQACSACRFFRRNEEKRAYKHSCCRRAPTPIAEVKSHFANGSLDKFTITTTITTEWPQIQSTDWCGEFEPNIQTEGPAESGPSNPVKTHE